MVFRNRDDLLEKLWEEGILSESCIDDFAKIREKLNEPTKTVMSYLGDIAALLIEKGLDTNYGVFGGYGVLTQLAGAHGDSIIPLWRGSEDIDMFGTAEILKSIRGGYRISNDRPSPNIPNKHTVKINTADGAEPETRIDFILTPQNSKRYETEEIVLMGIHVQTSTPLELVRSKIDFATKESKQLQDVYAMLSVLEKRSVEPKEIASELQRHKAITLYNILVAENGRKYAGVRLGITASDAYIKDLKSALKLK